MPPAHPGDLPLLLSKFRDGNFSNISSSEDIQGGVDYGIDTCWYNPNAEARSEDLRITYEARRLLNYWRCLSNILYPKRGNIVPFWEAAVANKEGRI